jgi:Homeodomain-like domain
MQIKTGAWRRDLAGLQQRRLEAARMFACGATQAEVARTFAVSRQAASVWYRQWHHGGEPALRGAGRVGRPRGCQQRSWAPSSRPCGLARKCSGSTPSCGRCAASRW